MTLPVLSIAAAVEQLRAGQVIAYPTEAVFGLGCDPRRSDAVQRLLQLKQRSIDSGLILVAANPGQLLAWVDSDHRSWRQALESWPGPITWVMPARSSVPNWVKGRHRGIAVRVSAHPVCQALCTGFGAPIISTSANPSGELPARTPVQVEDYFPAGLAGLVAGKLGRQQRPTAIRDLETGHWLRGGDDETE